MSFSRNPFESHVVTHTPKNWYFGKNSGWIFQNLPIMMVFYGILVKFCPESLENSKFSAIKILFRQTSILLPGGSDKFFFYFARFSTKKLKIMFPGDQIPDEQFSNEKTCFRIVFSYWTKSFFTIRWYCHHRSVTISVLTYPCQHYCPFL